jgi:hypothetical protein
MSRSRHTEAQMIGALKQVKRAARRRMCLSRETWGTWLLRGC